jgi:hypothetical protein
MVTQIDPRLKAQMDVAGEDGEVDALVMLSDQAKGADSGTPDAGAKLIDRVSQQTQQQPTHARYLPKLGVLHVRGSGRFVRRLLDEDDVVSASANAADITL